MRADARTQRRPTVARQPKHAGRRRSTQSGAAGLRACWIFFFFLHILAVFVFFFFSILCAGHCAHGPRPSGRFLAGDCGGRARNDGPDGLGDGRGKKMRTCAARSAPPVHQRLAIALDTQIGPCVPAHKGRPRDATCLCVAAHRAMQTHAAASECTNEQNGTTNTPKRKGGKKKQIAMPTKNKQAVSY